MHETSTKRYRAVSMIRIHAPVYCKIAVVGNDGAHLRRHIMREDGAPTCVFVCVNVMS